jgi:hypothetical protein
LRAAIAVAYLVIGLAVAPHILRRVQAPHINVLARGQPVAYTLLLMLSTPRWPRRSTSTSPSARSSPGTGWSAG